MAEAGLPGSVLRRIWDEVMREYGDRRSPAFYEKMNVVISPETLDKLRTELAARDKFVYLTDFETPVRIATPVGMARVVLAPVDDEIFVC